jgi:membrane protease YdiL (CAAX protease family)
MSDSHNPPQGHEPETNTALPDADVNLTPAQDATAEALWTQQAPVPPAQLFPKEKKEWGLFEVLNSFLISVCLQVVIVMAVFFDVLYGSVGRGGEGTSEAELTKALEDSVLQPHMILISSFALYVPWVFMMWYSTRYRGRKSFAKDFWVRIKWIDAPLGLLVAIVLTTAVQGISMGLTALGIDLSTVDNTGPFRNHEFIWQLILFVGLAGILGPIMEELFFRGFLLQALIRHFNRGDVHEPRSQFGLTIQRNQAWLFNTYLSFRNWGYRYQYALSAVISSIIFGFAHFAYSENMTPEQLTGAFIIVGITGMLGLVFAFLTLKTKRIGINMFGHIFYNSIVAVMALTM